MMNKKDLEYSVDQFVQYFSQRLDEIKQTEFKESRNLFKKVLYAGLIDALAKTTSHKKRGNRDRIVTFIENFSDWGDAEKICLPHLIRLLDKVPDPEFSNLKDLVYPLFDEWQPGNIFGLDADPENEEIRRLWPSSIPKPLENIQVSFFQHKSLFYNYRNSLVHELREPGYGTEFKIDDAPFYHSFQDVDTDTQTWELVYPVGFYERIIENSLNNLRDYYLRDRIDPYSCFVFGTYWFDELNS